MSDHISSEHEEQKGFVRWFRQKYPGVILFAIPNGGKRSIKTAVALREEGVLPGVPDMYIPAWHLWLEMKKKEQGKISESQVEMFRYLRECGYNIILGYGATDMSMKVIDFASHVKVK